MLLSLIGALAYQGGATVTGTVTAPTATLNAASPFWIDGTISVGAGQAYVRLTKGGAQEGGWQTPFQGGGAWGGELTPLASGSYAIELWTAQSGGTLLASRTVTVAAAFAGPVQEWRVTASAVYDSSNSTTDKAAILAAQKVGGSKALVPISVGAAVSNGTIGYVIQNALGTGYADGTYTLGVSGGSGSGFAGRYVCAGGIVQAIIIDAPGAAYTSGAGLPTISFPSGGGNGASATAGLGTNAPVMRTISIKLAAIGAAGGMLGYVPNGNAWAIQLYESADSTDGTAATGTWTAIPHAFYVPIGLPQNAINAKLRGQTQKFGAGAANRWIRAVISNSDCASGVSIAMGIFDLNAVSGGAADLISFYGSSVTYGDTNPLVVRERIQGKYPGRDPFILNGGYPGANGGIVYSSQVVPVLAMGLPIGVHVVDIGLNDLARPYAFDGTYGPDPHPDQAGTNMATIINALLASGVGRVFATNGEHANWAVKSGYPTVNDLANTAAGAEPYNTYQFNPTIKALVPGTSWDRSVDLPAIDQQTPFQLAEPVWFFSSDGVHPAQPGIPEQQALYDRVYAAQMTGWRGTSFIRAAVDAVAGGMPAYHKARWQTLWPLLPPTTDALATAGRAAQKAKIDAAPTAYAEPALTAPTARPNLLAWFDPADWGTLQATVGGAGGLVDGRVAQITSKEGSGYVLTQATATKQPICRPSAVNGRGMLRGANAHSLANASAALKGALDGTGSFGIVFAVLVSGNGQGSPFFGWGTGLLNRLMVGPSGISANGIGSTAPIRIFGMDASTGTYPNGRSLYQDTASLPANRPVVYGVLYDASSQTLSFWRNGVQVGSAAWPKPPWSGDSFALLGNGPANGACFADLGDFILRTGYAGALPVADLQADMAYAMAKYGVS